MEQTCLEVLGEKLEDTLKDLHLHKDLLVDLIITFKLAKKGPTGHGLVCR